MEEAGSRIKGALKSLYWSLMLFSGGGESAPRTAPGRMLLVVWTLLVLTLVSWYTADLAGSRAQVTGSPQTQDQLLAARVGLLRPRPCS